MLSYKTGVPFQSLAELPAPHQEFMFELLEAEYDASRRR